MKDIRWQQRFNNYNNALAQLEKFVAKKDSLSELEEQGLIKAFEYTYELGWNTIKDFYEDQGETNMQDSKDAIRLAFNRGLVSDGDGWMGMVKNRTRTAHTYNKETADEVAAIIINKHFALFKDLQKALEKIQQNKQ